MSTRVGEIVAWVLVIGISSVSIFDGKQETKDSSTQNSNRKRENLFVSEFMVNISSVSFLDDMLEAEGVMVDIHLQLWGYLDTLQKSVCNTLPVDIGDQ